jgi:Flp pilus assembly protein TadD
MKKADRSLPWYLAAVVLATLVLSIYWQVGGHDFVNIDDSLYVTENPVVLQGLAVEGVSWAISTFHAGNWHPLTWLSHMLDVELFGPSPGWHHRMNVLFHLLNTEFLFFVLWRMTGGPWRSVLVAALFGVHPLHVESVAWVAERKDLLSTLFWILTMGAYLGYVRRPGRGRYILVVVTFALGLMSKPMLVTLPFVLLLLDWWPLGRLVPPDAAHVPRWRISGSVLSRLLSEKVPLFLLSAISCAVTYRAQAEGGAVASLGHIPLGSRVANALVSYIVYLGNAIWPSSLAVYYPFPAALQANTPAWKVVGAILLLCGFSVVALRKARRAPYLAVGWLWYLGTLMPVIGLVQVGIQARADRYTYVPLIGIFVAIAWAMAPLLAGRRYRRLVLGALAGGSLAALSMAAWVQAGYWHDSVTLLSRAVTVTDRNWFALNNLGFSHNGLGQYRPAIGRLREALSINPGDAEAWNNLGVSYYGLRQYREATAHFREAVRIKPDLSEAWNNLGASYRELGECQQAVGYLREAVRINPNYAEAWNELGVCYRRLGQDRQAIACFGEALRIRPGFPEARKNLAAGDSELRGAR